MMSLNKSLGFLALGVSVLTLGACSLDHPNAMPSGYTHHQKEFKSGAPAPSSKVTNKQRDYMDAEQAEQFRSAVYDLLTRLTQRAGFPPKPAYIAAPDPMTVFYANIDNDLRESMRAIGYALSTTPQGAYVFAYDAMEIKGAAVGEPNVQITLKVFDSATPMAKQLTEETGAYYIKGAETLYIKPTEYSNLPTYQQIQSQIDGYETYEPQDRTATGSLSSFNESTYEGSSESVVVIPPAAYDYQMEVEVPMVPAPVESEYYAEPSEGVMIDSNAVSYTDPVEDYSLSIPSSNHGRVSKAIEY